MITSSQNRVIKEIKALSKKRERTKKGLFIAEGLRFVQSAVEVGADIETIVYSQAVFRTDEGRAFIQSHINEGNYRLLEVVRYNH